MVPLSEAHLDVRDIPQHKVYSAGRPIVCRILLRRDAEQDDKR